MEHGTARKKDKTICIQTGVIYTEGSLTSSPTWCELMERLWNDSASTDRPISEYHAPRTRRPDPRRRGTVASPAAWNHAAIPAARLDDDG